MAKKIEYKIGPIEMTITCSDKDYEWLYLLFTRNANPLKALRDIGYMPVEHENESEDDSEFE